MVTSAEAELIMYTVAPVIAISDAALAAWFIRYKMKHPKENLKKNMSKNLDDIFEPLYKYF